MSIDDGLIVKHAWDFPVAKTLKACGYCGRRAGFHDDTVELSDDQDRDHVFAVRVCNHCGEFNGEVRDE